MVCLYLNDCLMFQYPQKMGINNIYIVMTSYGVCSIIGVAVVSHFSAVIKRRAINLFSCITLSVLSLSLLFLRNYSQNKTLGYIVFGLTCLMRMATDIGFCLIFTYCTELFPTKIRAFTSGIVVYVGRLTNVFGPQLVYLADMMNIHPLVFAGIPSLLGIIASFLLPETLNQKLMT